MNWGDYEMALPRALEALDERYPGKRIDILECFDIAWVGWEGDSRGALITVDGVPKLVAIEQTINEGDFERQIIERMPEYRRLLDETTRVLRSLWYRRAALRHASEEAAQFPDEIEHVRRFFEDAKREMDGIDALPPPSDWTPEDDRLVLIGQITEQIEAMPIGDLERVLSAAKAVARPGGKIPVFGDTLPSAMHEVLAHIEGRTVVEISESMGDSRWWDRLCKWVDDKRAGR